MLFIAVLVFCSGCIGGEADIEVEPTPQKEDMPSYTLDDVSSRSSADDCWIALHGKVYDVTGFIASGRHGPAILEGCGTDGTELFETRPMGSGTPHSQNARRISEEYLIGYLVDSQADEEGISLSEVSSHNSRQSCWSVVDGEVYDLTEFIDNHPGGAEAVIGLCGMDGTSRLRGRHGMGKDETLNRYYLGKLKIV
jgi:cytochrome b involved in lipid metabolism